MKLVTISDSKSLANRLLILASFDSLPLPEFNSKAKDVLELRENLTQFLNGRTEFYISHGGTTFRFFLARISRQPGKYTIKTSDRLLSRPHAPLYAALKVLGVDVQQVDGGVLIESAGWVNPKRKIAVNCEHSSQFASSLLLASKDLAFDLQLELLNLNSSRLYWQMTQLLFANQVLPKCEIDMSSAFSVAALMIAGANIAIDRFPNESIQPDFRFVEILERMNLRFEKTNHLKALQPSYPLTPIDLDLSDTPDLTPVLAILCLLADGESRLRNISQLVYKESNRVAKTIELIELSGGQARLFGDDLVITGSPQWLKQLAKREFEFDPDEDHRMAMAAAVTKKLGAQITILNSQVVEKSFPGFWQQVEVIP